MILVEKSYGENAHQVTQEIFDDIHSTSKLFDISEGLKAFGIVLESHKIADPSWVDPATLPQTAPQIPDPNWVRPQIPDPNWVDPGDGTSAPMIDDVYVDAPTIDDPSWIDPSTLPAEAPMIDDPGQSGHILTVGDWVFPESKTILSNEVVEKDWAKIG